MVKQQNRGSLELLLEFPDSSIMRRLGNESFRGIRRECGMPCFVTVTALVSEEHFVFDEQSRYLLYVDLPNILDGGSRLYGRIICKPYWFHKLVYNNKG